MHRLNHLEVIVPRFITNPSESFLIYVSLFLTVTPPAQRVQFILGEDIDADGQTLESHPLFSEMEELFKDGDDLEWKETARWVKFEEDVEEGKNVYFCP